MTVLSLGIMWKDYGAEKGLLGLGDAAEKAEKKFSGAKKAIATGAGAAGLAAGAALSSGFAANLDIEAGRAKLGAQLGLTADKSAQVGKTAGKLYAANYGASMEEVNEAIRGVMVNIDGMRDASAETLEDVTKKVLNLQNTTGETSAAISTAISQMLRNGLAKNADEALDVLTVGFQKGVDKSEDLLDTFNEYGTQFRKFGLDGKAATGLMSQGLKAGARDADTVADAIKEFAIRSIDGSETTKDGFKAIGLSARNMADQIEQGGPKAEKALGLTLDKLRDMKDPTEREAAAVALFGTKAEDLGAALFAMDTDTAVQELGNVSGAAERMDKTLGETGQARIESMKRGFEQWTQSMAGSEGPLGDVTAGVVGFAGPGLAMAGNVGMLVAGLAALNLGALASAASTVALSVAAGVARTATMVWTGVQWALNTALTANPIGLVVVAIGLLVTGIVLAYKKSETFRRIVNTAFVTVARSALNMADTIIHAAADALGWMPGVGPKLKAAAKEFDKFKDRANAALDGIVDENANITLTLRNRLPAQYRAAFDSEVRRDAARAQNRATGGPVWGSGTETSDSIPAYLSNNEHVWTAREVRAAGGHRAVASLRRSVLGRGIGSIAAQFAGGGPVQLGITARTQYRDEFGKIPQEFNRRTKYIADNIAGQMSAIMSAKAVASMGAASLGGSGWARQWAVLHKQFPDAQLTSSFRPGAITTSGNRSYHSMGRAIDVSPSMAIFNWLRTVFGKTSKEIIYSPAGNRQIKNGRDHYYTGAVRAMHYNHVHWAYDQGGVATGAGPFWKGKKPERVLSPSQTRSFDQLVQVLDRSTGPGSAIAAGATIDYRQLGDQVARALSGMAVKLDGRQVGTVLGASAALMGRA